MFFSRGTWDNISIFDDLLSTYVRKARKDEMFMCHFRPFPSKARSDSMDDSHRVSESNVVRHSSRHLLREDFYKKHSEQK